MKKGWEIKKLGEVCEVNCGSTPLRGNKLFWENGTFPWFTIEDIREQGRIINSTKQKVTNLALTKLKLFPENTVLLCCTASVGEYALTKIQITSNQQFNGLTVSNTKQLYPNFLFHFCSTLKETLLNLSGKTTIDFVSQSKIKEIDIPIPTISEQQHIVQILDEAFEKIDTLKANAERNLQNAKELFQSALTEELKPKKGWEEKTIKEISTHLGDGLHGTPKYTEDGEYHFINGNNLTKGIISFKESTKRVNTEEYQKYKKNLNERSVLVSINGTLGNVAFYNNEKIILGKSACYFNLKENVNKYFIMHIIASPTFINYAHKEATGATIKNVSLKSMREFKIPLPPLKVQQTIVEHLDTLSSHCKGLEANYQRTIAQCEEMKKAVLGKAFRGEL